MVRAYASELRDRLKRPVPSFTLTLLLAVALPMLALVLYSGSLENGFLNFDDPQYVTANSHVLQGLSRDGIAWSFTATEAGNWHPLTWISHMTDVEFFGDAPWGPHLVNVLLHAINVFLLFLALRSATGRALASAGVAALFAVHPLNVENVAWVAERKSLLSMFFLLLGLLAYTWYARRPGLVRNP